MLRTAMLILFCTCTVAAWSAGAAIPDALVKGPSQNAYVGGGVYNDIAAQTVSAGIADANPAVFWLRIENDGTAADTFVAQGTGDGDGWTARYYDAGGTERTGLFTSGAAIFPLAAGAAVEARVEIYASPTLASQPNRVFTLAVATVNSRQSDSVFAMVYRIPPVSAVRLAGPSSPLPQGLPITLTATPTGGINPQYRFLVRPSTASSYTVGRDWGAPTWTDWHPTASSTSYVVKAQVRENSAAKVIDSNALYYTVKPAVSALTLVGSPASPTAVGQKVVLTTAVTGGANLLYKYVATLEGAEGPVDTFTRDYTTGRTTWWTPAEPGTYTVTAYVKEAAGDDPLTRTVNYEVKPALSALALRVNNPPAMPNGMYATVTNMSFEVQAVPTGGGTLEYWWHVGYRSSPTATTVWDTTTYPFRRVGGIMPYRATAPGYYYFTVYARERGSTGNRGSNTVRVQVNPPVTSYAASFTRNATTGVVTIKVTNIVGGAAPQWKFWARPQGTSSWGTPIRDYALGNSVEWTPPAPGTYEVSIAVKELGSKATYFDLKLNPFTYTAP